LGHFSETFSGHTAAVPELGDGAGGAAGEGRGGIPDLLAGTRALPQDQGPILQNSISAENFSDKFSDFISNSNSNYKFVILSECRGNLS
jgi:hypothetical protein